MATIKKRNGKYQVLIRRKGHAPAYKTFSSLPTAKKWVRITEADMERGLFQPIPDISVAEILKRYEREIVPQHKNAARHEKYRLDRLRSVFGKLPVAGLRPSLVARYRDERLDIVSPATVRRELVILRSALNIAIRDWGVCLPSNPVAQITLPKDKSQRIRRLERVEESKLIEKSNTQLRRLIIVAIETGMRRGEILNIKRSHIDLLKRVLFIPSTKTDTPRTIPLSTVAVSALREQLSASQSESGGVIPLHEQPLFSYSPNGVTGGFLKLCRKVGIEDLRFHDLRHEATSRLFEKGLTQWRWQQLLGTKTPRCCCAIRI